jgi:hypothetical protein
MMRRPMARRPMGRGGLLGTAARTAVVAGTATAVVGGVSHRQEAKAAQAADAQAYQEQQQAAAMQAAAEQAAAQQAAAAPPAPASDPVAELERLAKLKEQGILTDEEFAAAKAKLLGI